MTGSDPVRADQRLRPVVAVQCDGTPKLCKALIQAMSAAAPGPIYRINPDPVPTGAPTVRVELGPNDTARLQWSDGAGEFAERDGHNDAEFARHIVANASPGLVHALTGS